MMKRSTKYAMLLWLFLSGQVAFAANHPVSIRLNNDFIQSNMNAVTISTNAFEVDFTRPHRPVDDGDMHIAGRSPDFGLPTVAEIMNVGSEPDAAAAADGAKGNTPISLTGVWRFWCEHANGADQTQGDPIPPYPNSNPDHVFEIHPITKIGDVSLISSLTDIDGYPAHDGDQAFPKYDAADSTISFDDTTTTITTPSVGFNYVRFWIAPSGAPHQTTGGSWAFAQISDDAGKVLEQNKRVFFIGGSSEESAVNGLASGDRLHVLGIPRIDLALVWYRRIHAINNPDILTWKLPYEMVIVGLVK